MAYCRLSILAVIFSSFQFANGRLKLGNRGRFRLCAKVSARPAHSPWLARIADTRVRFLTMRERGRISDSGIEKMKEAPVLPRFASG
jgi:hypothetical protein